MYDFEVSEEDAISAEEAAISSIILWICLMRGEKSSQR